MVLKFPEICTSLTFLPRLPELSRLDHDFQSKRLPSTSQRSGIRSVPFRVSSLPHVGSLVCWLCSEKHLRCFGGGLKSCRFAQVGGFLSLESCRTTERWRSATAAADQMARNPKQRMRPEAMEFGRLLGLN